VVISDLVEMLLATAPASLDSIFFADWEFAESDDQRLRVIIDQVASLTDPAAYIFHARLTSQIDLKS
jgi:dGTPase